MDATINNTAITHVNQDDTMLGAVTSLALSGVNNANTRRAMTRQVVNFMKWLDGRAITPLAVESYIAELKQSGLAASSVNQALTAIKRIMAKAKANGLVDDRLAESVKDIKQANESTELAGRYVSIGERKQGIAQIKQSDSPKAKRDLAIVALLQMGIRRGTIVKLTIDNIDLANQELKRFTTKRGKVMSLPMSAAQCAIIGDYLALRGTGEGYLFWSCNKKGQLKLDSCLQDQTVYDICVEYFQARPHDFRRSFVSDLLDSGTDMATIAGLTGHSSLDMVKRYDRRNERARRVAMNNLVVAE